MATERDLDLARRALAVNAANLALGNEVFAADGCDFVRNTAYPSIRDANHVRNVTASTPDEIERVFARTEREFAGFPHRRFDVDFTTPPSFEARLALDGYERSEALVMLLEDPLNGVARECDIRPVTGDAAWSEFERLSVADWREYRARLTMLEEPDAGMMMVRSHEAKSPPVRVWLAYDEGRACGFLSSWEGLEGMGQVEGLFVLAEYRHRGIATALLRHCVDDCRKHGAREVVIVADPTDTPKQMYAAMGFRPIGIKREYRRLVD